MALDTTFTPDTSSRWWRGWEAGLAFVTRPDLILDYHMISDTYLISIPESAESDKPTILSRTLLSSSTGLLDALPIGLPHIILNSLVFQSLSRFAQVCHQAKTTAESLLSYQSMIEHASTALIALSRTNMITFHTASTLHTALLSDKCVSCQRLLLCYFSRPANGAVTSVS